MTIYRIRKLIYNVPLMPRPPLLRPWPLVRTSMTFVQKQPVLYAIALWLLILPATLIRLFERIEDDADILSSLPLATFLERLDPQGILGPVLIVLLTLVSIWGEACILLVGKRMVQSRAGRPRTSLRIVCGEASAWFIPLLFTSVLRLCTVFYWSLLFIIPALFLMITNHCGATLLQLYAQGRLVMEQGVAPKNASALLLNPCIGFLLLLLPLLIPAIIYAVRTTFFAMSMFLEDRTYRSALKRSAEVVRPHFWLTLWLLVAISVILFFPSLVLDWLLHTLATHYDERLLAAADILSNCAYALASILLTLAMFAAYGKLRDLPVRVKR